MNFEESLQWLYGYKQYGSKLGLERISYLVERLDNPQDKIKIIHVTGTNGKGSVCKFIASILNKAGYTVGVYISPHLQRFSERIVLNNREISDEDIVLLIEKIKPIVDEMIKKNNIPTFFEIVTAIAFQFFHDKCVDYAVVEVGLGGRFDATNIVYPSISVITNVSLEHTAQLGEDIRSIAFEKAGIIKKDTQVITAATKDAKDVIEKTAKEKNSPFSYIDRKSWKRLAYDTNYQEFYIHGAFRDYTVKTSLLGAFQGENIALAIATIEQLQSNGVYLTDDDIIEGIATTSNPGRMEVISTEPTILLDGAHNPVAIEMLKKTIMEDFRYKRFILVVGILKDKAIKKMLSTIIPASDVIIITKNNNPRACEPKILKDKIEKLIGDKELHIEYTLPKAIEYAKSLAQKDDLICITGSLFTVGEARTYLAKSLKMMIQY